MLNEINLIPTPNIVTPLQKRKSYIFCLFVSFLVLFKYATEQKTMKMHMKTIAIGLFMQFCLTSVIAFTTQAREREEFLNVPPHYHTEGELLDLFARMAKAYPEISRVHSLGRSLDGRDLPVIEISGNIRQRNLLVPMFKYVANMHGDETIGREMMIYLAQYLLDNYGVVPEVTNLVDTTDIFLMPTMNPDGYNRSRVSDQIFYLLNFDV